MIQGDTTCDDILRIDTLFDRPSAYRLVIARIVEKQIDDWPRGVVVQPEQLNQFGAAGRAALCVD